jgi:membrane protease YdiL (CAAX protease family)
VAQVASENRWQAFWNRGGWWKAVLAAVVYIALYLGAGALTSTIFAGMIDETNLFGTGASVFFGVALPILIGAILLLLFIRSLGWFREIFGPQPIKGSGWMWIAVVLVLIPIVLHVAATNWGEIPVDVIVATLFMGLCIGVAEELLTRGVAVNLLRKAGYGEKSVMVLSSAIFALLHAQNIIGGQNPLATLLELPYTFGFGLMMYLVLRVTGSIVWPILLHAATDPTTTLAVGGIAGLGGEAGSASTSPLLGIASVFNWVFLIVGLIALFFVKGRVHPKVEVGAVHAR